MTAATGPDMDTFVQLDRRVRNGRIRIDEARERGFDVTAWDAQWQELRDERNRLADELFRDHREGAPR